MASPFAVSLRVFSSLTKCRGKSAVFGIVKLYLINTWQKKKKGFALYGLFNRRTVVADHAMQSVANALFIPRCWYTTEPFHFVSSIADNTRESCHEEKRQVRAEETVGTSCQQVWGNAPVCEYSVLYRDTSRNKLANRREANKEFSLPEKTIHKTEEEMSRALKDTARDVTCPSL